MSLTDAVKHFTGVDVVTDHLRREDALLAGKPDRLPVQFDDLGLTLRVYGNRARFCAEYPATVLGRAVTPWTYWTNHG